MSDLETRELERKAAQGDKDAAQTLLKVRARKGEIEIREFGGKIYELRSWGARFRTDVYGNNRACDCPELKRVVGMFCVCYGRAWCPNHGGPRCVGGHD
jgi:hypothetical protein